MESASSEMEEEVYRTVRCPPPSSKGRQQEVEEEKEEEKGAWEEAVRKQWFGEEEAPPLFCHRIYLSPPFFPFELFLLRPADKSMFFLVPIPTRYSEQDHAVIQK